MKHPGLSPKRQGAYVNSSVGAALLPLMLVLFISTLDQTIVAAALGRIGAELGSASQAPWIATAYLLTSAVTTLLFGKLGDVIGRKPVLQASIFIFVCGSVLCAAAPSMAWLIAARALQGVGGGGLNSLVMAIVGDLAPPRERARHQATLGVVPAVAIVLGPLLGGFIVDHWGWMWIFLINVPIGFAALWTIAARLHLPARGSEHRIDWAGAILVVLFTVSALLICVLGGQSYAWTSPQILGLCLVAGIALPAYLVVEHRASEPITPLPLLASSIFSISAALFFLSTAVLFAAMLFAPQMLQSAYGMSAFAAGACIVPLLLGIIAGTMIAGSAISRTGRYKKFPILASLLSGAGLVFLGTVNLATPLWMMLCALATLGVGLGFFIQVVVLAGQNAVAHRHLGTATGTLNFFKTMGGATGAAVLGAVLAARLVGAHKPAQILAAFHPVFIDAAVLMAVAFCLAAMLREKPLSAEMIEIAEGRADAPEY